MIRTYKYRLLPTKKQHKVLASILEDQRHLYNAALQERIDYYQKTGKTMGYFGQTASLTILRKEPEFAVYPVCLQRGTLKRLDRAYKSFFRYAGFPHFKSRDRFKSFGFTEMQGVWLESGRISFKGFSGSIKIHMHRPVAGEVKLCSFVRERKGWFLCLSVAQEAPAETANKEAVGVDVGLSSLATLSTGEAIPAPQIARRAHAKIRRRSRALERCKRGSKRRAKVRARLTKAHEKIKNTRQTFLHQQSKALIDKCGTVVVEDLKVKNLVKNHTVARSISDAGWSTFVQYLTYKAENSGGKVIKVDPRHTSQACSGCGQTVAKKLEDRIHSCDCGTVLDRDHNAAINILHRGVMVPGLANVAHSKGKRSTGNAVSTPHGSLPIEAAMYKTQPPRSAHD
jgi:putative transposase